MSGFALAIIRRDMFEVAKLVFSPTREVVGRRFGYLPFRVDEIGPDRTFRDPVGGGVMVELRHFDSLDAVNAFIRAPETEA